MTPGWLEWLAILALASGACSALVVIFDLLAGHRQHMWIMNLVWPITVLYSGPLGLLAYYRIGRLSTHRAMHHAQQHGEPPPGKRKPFWQTVAVATTHCGGGCTLGDVVAEWMLFCFPLTLLGQRMFAAWLADFILAYLFGIAFQYFTIKPMKQLTPGQGLIAAIQADTLSLAAWQLGMYGWMAIARFLIFGRELPVSQPLFWFMMQIAMLAGFATAYPVNWWLVRSGIKEAM
ncbi:MAG TPA: DUF4396 domain-containing protein [Pirellulales bacterium]